jgi:hypothetical protein
VWSRVFYEGSILNGQNTVELDRKRAFPSLVLLDTYHGIGGGLKCTAPGKDHRSNITVCRMVRAVVVYLLRHHDVVFVVCVYNEQVALLQAEMKDLLERFGDQNDSKTDARLRIGTSTRLQGLESDVCVVAFEGSGVPALLVHVPRSSRGERHVVTRCSPSGDCRQQPCVTRQSYVASCA